MAPRPTWKGFFKLSLVSCSVALYPATTTTERIHFHVINRKTGNRIRNDVVDVETHEAVPADTRVKGYEFAKGEYLLLEDDELDNVALESSHSIDIAEFVRIEEIDRIYLDESFYIVPEGDVAQEAFAVNNKVPADMLKLATEILESKRGHFDPDQIEDRYEQALQEMIAASAGNKPHVVSAPTPNNVINLMDRRSSTGGKPAKTPVRKQAKAKRLARKKARKAS